MTIKNIRKLIKILLFTLIFVTQSSSANIDNRFSTGLAMSFFMGGIATFGAALLASFMTSGGDSFEDITADSIVFTDPNTQNLVLTNPNSQAVNVDEVLLLNGLNDVSVGSLDECQPIPPNGTCNIPITADENAYGNGTAEIKYDDDKSITTSIGVVSVTLDLYKCKARNDTKTACETWETNPTILTEDIILEAEKSPQFYRYENSGNFNWQKTDPIDWKTPFPPDADIVLAENTTDPISKCNAPYLEPGESCVFTFTDTDGLDHPGDWGTIKATGENLVEVNKNALGKGGLEIVENLNTDDYHLGYRSLKVVNTVEGKTVTLNKLTIDVDPNENKVKYCSPTDSSCAYKTDASCQVGQTLAASGGSCRIWFKANPNPNNMLNKDESIEIEVTAGGECSGEDPPDETDSFKVTYEHALYVGGEFSQAGGEDAYKTAKWNGTEWASLGTGTNNGIGGNDVRTLATNGGIDLYAGGNIVMAGGEAVKNIARWNGTSWSSSILGLGLNYPVYSLTNINNDLYAGGGFIQANTIPANRVAKWDGTSWSALGSGTSGTVNAITSIGNKLYATGYFTHAGGTLVNYIAEWDGTSWSALGSGMANGQVFALTSTNNNKLYASGYYPTAGGLTVRNIAEWDGTSWAQLIDPYNIIGVNNNALALTSINNDVYAGGWITKAGNTNVRYIAKWDGVSWSALGPGLNLLVRTLTSLGNYIYAGGWFTQTGDGSTPVNYVAEWNGTSWSQLGTSVNYRVSTLTTAPSLLIEHITQPP